MSGFQHERMLDRAGLRRAFEGLEQRLEVRDVRAHVYVVGARRWLWRIAGAGPRWTSMR